MQLTAEELKKLLGRDLTTVRPEILAALTGQQQPGAVPGGGVGAVGPRDTLAEEKQLLARLAGIFGKTSSAPGGAPGGGGGNAGGPSGPAEPLTPQEIMLARSMISGRTRMTSPMSLPLPSPSAKVTPKEKPSAKPPAGARGEGQDRLAMGVSPAEMDTDITKPTAAGEEPAAEGFPGWAKAAIAVGGVGLLSAIIANQIKQERKSDIAPSGTRMIGAGLSALGQFMGQRQRQQVWQEQQEQDRLVRLGIAKQVSRDKRAKLLVDIATAKEKAKPTPPVGMMMLAIRYGLGDELLESWSKGSIPEGLTAAMQKDYETSSAMERYKIAALLMRGLEGLQTAVLYMGEEGAKLKPAIEHYTTTITELVGGQAPGAAAMSSAGSEEIYDTSTTGSEEDYERIAETLKTMDPIERAGRKYQIGAEMVEYGFDPNSPLWQKHIAPLLE